MIVISERLVLTKFVPLPEVKTYLKHLANAITLILFEEPAPFFIQKFGAILVPQKRRKSPSSHRKGLGEGKMSYLTHHEGIELVK